jgi:fucose permease
MGQRSGSSRLSAISTQCLERLGPYTKLGSSLLVMSIVGGAIVPAVMGYVSDLRTIQTAFLMPFLCYVYVLYFAARGYRPTSAVRAAPGLEPAARA